MTILLNTFLKKEHKFNNTSKFDHFAKKPLKGGLVDTGPKEIGRGSVQDTPLTSNSHSRRPKSYFTSQSPILFNQGHGKTHNIAEAIISFNYIPQTHISPV